MNIGQLGVDLIKEQQKINLKFSLNQTAVISEDRAQVMLAGVCISCMFECAYFQLIQLLAYERTNQHI